MTFFKAAASATAICRRMLLPTGAYADYVVATAKSVGTFETLLAAAEVAGLADALATTRTSRSLLPPIKRSRRFRRELSTTC